jgi:hypothetical protein
MKRNTPLLVVVPGIFVVAPDPRAAPNPVATDGNA